MCSSPKVAMAFSAARNSSSPWETVPVRIATFQLPSSATAAVTAMDSSIANARTMLNTFFMLGSSSCFFVDPIALP